MRGLSQKNSTEFFFNNAVHTLRDCAIAVPEFIDPVLGVKMVVYAKTSPKRTFSIQFVPRDASLSLFWMRLVPEIIDTVFAITSPKRSFSMTEYERFRLDFMKTRVYKFGH
jgi:hypothetical protein